MAQQGQVSQALQIEPTGVVLAVAAYLLLFALLRDRAQTRSGYALPEHELIKTPE
jgi:hypothetical protein